MTEKQAYRTKEDMPTERAVLEREWIAMRKALAMPSESRVALLKAQAVLRGLSFKTDQITSALESIHRALEQQ